MEEVERVWWGVGLGFILGSFGGLGYYGYYFFEMEVSFWGLIIFIWCFLVCFVWEIGLKVGGLKGKFVLEKNL